MSSETTVDQSQEPDPVVRAYMRDIDRTLILRNLALSCQARFLQLMELQRFAEELGAAGRRARER